MPIYIQFGEIPRNLASQPTGQRQDAADASAASRLLKALDELGIALDLPKG